MGSDNREDFRTDIPTIDVAMGIFIGKVVENFIKIAPLQKLIPIEKSVHRGPIRNVKGQDPLDQDSFITRATSYFDIHDIKTTNISRFTEFLYDLADQSLGELSRGFFSSLGEVLDRTDQVVNGKGKTFSFDLFLDLLEKVDIEFDEYGNPIMPVLAAYPEQSEKIRDLPKTADQEKREKEIIAKKKGGIFCYETYSPIILIR